MEESKNANGTTTGELNGVGIEIWDYCQNNSLEVCFQGLATYINC